MPTFTTDELYHERRAEETPQGYQGVRMFHVRTDDYTVTPLEVLRDSDVPTRYSPYIDADEPPYALVCMKRDAEPTPSDPTLWVVTCHYEPPRSTSQADGTAEEEGVDLTPEVEFLTQEVEVPVERAYANFIESEKENPGEPFLAITNSAGQPFDPPALDVKHRGIMRITVNQRTVQIPHITHFSNTVNFKDITVCGIKILKNTGLLRTMSVTPFMHLGETFFRCFYEIALNQDTWALKLLDQGFYTGTTTYAGYGVYTVAVTPILDDEGNPVTEPRLLNGSGGLLEGEGEDAHPVFREFFVKRAADWTALGLPEAFNADLPPEEQA